MTRKAPQQQKESQLRGAKLALFVFALMAISALAPGCSSWRYKSLPSRREFQEPLRPLLKRYPQLRKCEPGVGRILFTGIWDMPPAQALIKKWGEPHYTRPSFWNLLPYTLIPPFHPVTVWQWYFHDKEIDVLVDHPLIVGFEARVWTLEVSKVETVRPKKRKKRRSGVRRLLRGSGLFLRQ